MLKETYNSEIEQFVVELLYRIKLGKEYLSACNVYRNECHKQYIKEIKMAMDFFSTAFEALNTAMMLEFAKLCDDRGESFSVIKFFNRCQSDKSFSSIVEDRKSLEKITKDFFVYLEDGSVKKIIHNVKMRRDNYYAHSDKKYFTDIDKLVKSSRIYYEDIESVFNEFEKYCKEVYKLITKKNWAPYIHQGCISRQKNCYDIVGLLERAHTNKSEVNTNDKL